MYFDFDCLNCLLKYIHVFRLIDLMKHEWLHRGVAKTNFGGFTTLIGGSGSMLPQTFVIYSMSMILVNFWIKFMSSASYRILNTTSRGIAVSKRPKFSALAR